MSASQLVTTRAVVLMAAEEPAVPDAPEITCDQPTVLVCAYLNAPVNSVAMMVAAARAASDVLAMKFVPQRGCALACQTARTKNVVVMAAVVLVELHVQTRPHASPAMTGRSASVKRASVETERHAMTLMSVLTALAIALRMPSVKIVRAVFCAPARQGSQVMAQYVKTLMSVKRTMAVAPRMPFARILKARQIVCAKPVTPGMVKHART